MSEELETKLAKIKAACRLAIELGEKASDGPWTEDAAPRNCGLFGFVHSMGGMTWVGQVYDNPDSGLDPIDEEESDFNLAIILHARTFSPAAAQALLAAIETLERNATPAIGGKAQQYDAQQALQKIARQWPDL